LNLRSAITSTMAGPDQAALVGTADPCPVCAETQSRTVLTQMHRSLQRCKACGFLFVLPRPSREELARVYSEDYFEAGVADALAYRSPVFEECLDRLDVHRPYRGRLLDIGCGTGEFLEAATRRGWEVCGVELSVRAAQLAREKGLDVRCCTLSSAPYASGSFDAITCLDVLEHVADPLQDLQRARELLAPGGLFVIRVPNTVFHLWKTRACTALGVNDVGLQMDYHLNHFTPKTLVRTLRRCGFRAISLEVGAPETVAHAAWASPWAKRTYVQIARFVKAVTGAHLENIMVAYAEKAD
jgi:2-polyprenyl-3-methyl-5-hydroxy-6-metoxy-1,4-benzoquinol methylase